MLTQKPKPWRFDAFEASLPQSAEALAASPMIAMVLQQTAPMLAHAARKLTRPDARGGVDLVRKVGIFV